MLIKYYLYTLLVWIGLDEFKEKLTLLGNERVMHLITNNSAFVNLYKAGIIDTHSSKRKPHFITTPYLFHLLEEIKEGKTKQCETNTLLIDLFSPFRTRRDRVFFAHALTDSSRTDLIYLIKMISPVSYWDLTVDERETTIKFWMKDIPEHSRVKYYLSKRSDISFSDEVLIELFNILEKSDTYRSLLTAHYFAKCHSPEQIIATAKHLLQKHILANMKKRGVTDDYRYKDLAFYGTYDREKQRLLE